ncbi:MAG: flagellar M-ring protein FliF C-terminal domain-containing protein, partial [Pseudomonadota bacterium]
ASVTVGMAGGTLTEREAMAFRYLVALAVQGLSPEQVAVIDSRAGVILAPGDGSPLTRAGAEASAKEAKLKAEIEALLAARVGANRARVTVSLEIDRTGERVSERVLEPESRVVIHTDTEETSDSSSGTDPAVTVASNLPEGDAGGGERESNRNETRERSNYDYSEVRRERVREPGAIRKLSVAVLVDGITSTDANGNPVWQPRPAEELEALRALVRAAVGYDAERGDVVAVESMAFQPMPEEELLEAGLAERLVERNALPLVQLLVLLGVVALIVFTVLRPMLLRQPEPEGGFEVLSQIDGEEGAAALEADQASIEQSEGSLEDQLEDALFNLPDRETLRSAVLEFPDQSVATLRDWLEQEDAL